MEAVSALEKAIADSTDIRNPFAQKLKFTAYDKVKIAVLSVTLFPIRCLIILVFFIAAWLLTRIVLTEKGFQQKPISGWRRRILKPAVHGSLRVVFAAAGFHWVPIRGRLANQKEAPILVMAPHSTFFEIMPVVLLGGPSVLAKVETANVPVYGDLISFSQPVYVQQNDRLSRQRTVRDIRHRAFSNENWQQIAIFPEGTCSNRSALINFKQGAFYPGVPVQPVCLSYPNRSDTVSWTWQGASGWKNMWLCLCQFHNYCEIEVLPVYNPTKAEVQDPKLYARNVQQVMAKHLKVPTSDWSFNDIRYIRWASKEKIPISIPLVKLIKLRDKLGLNGESPSVTISKTETKLKTCSTTKCDNYAFAQLLDVDATTEVFQEFFDTLDQEREVTVDSRSYLCCLWLLHKDVFIWKRIQELFKILSDDDKLEIRKPEFCLLCWILLTIPTKEATSVFQTLCKTAASVQYSDFQKCLQNSDSAMSIMNVQKVSSEKEPYFGNDYFDDNIEPSVTL